MNNNEHNPVAIRINKLQRFWISKNLSNYKYINIRSNHEDMSLIEGFLKLESSIHGMTDTIFHIMVSPFTDIISYTQTFINNWISEFEKEQNKNTSLKWSRKEEFKQKYVTANTKDEWESLFLDMIVDYKADLVKNHHLCIGIHPTEITNIDSFREWFLLFYEQLPKNVSFITVDSIENPIFQSFIKSTPNDIGHLLHIPNLETRKAYEELMIAGNPNDIHIQFRKCMWKMGDAVAQKQESELHKWGEKILHIAQSSGDRNLWSSAYAIYASFLLNFANYPLCLELIDKGIHILSSEEEDQNHIMGILQLYSLKGSIYSIQKDINRAIDTFISQASIAEKHNLPMNVLQAYTYLFLIANKDNLIDFHKHIEKAYQYGTNLDKETLIAMNFGYFAYHYYPLIEHNPIKKKEFKNNMIEIYGDHWEEEIKSTNLTLQNNRNHVISK